MLIGAIADDLSGAAGLAGDFGRLGLSACTVSVDALDCSAIDVSRAAVVVVDTDSRTCSQAESAERHRRAARWLLERTPRLIIVKVDSLLRGHVGANLAALMGESAQPRSLAICAIPEHDRTTRNGLVYLGEVPFTDPATDSVVDVRDVFRRTGGYAVHHLASELVRTGAMWPEVWHHGGVVVADVMTAEDRQAVVRWAFAVDIRIVAATYGIAAPITTMLARNVQHAPVLVLCGSVSENAKRQTEVALLRGDLAGVSLDPVVAPDRLQERLADSVAHASQLLQRGCDVLVQTWETAAMPEAIPDTAAIDVFRAFCDRLLPNAAKYLGAVVATGGATAAAFLGAAGANGTVCTGVEAANCAPVLRVRGGALDGLLLLTKPGSFGGESALSALVDSARIAMLADHLDDATGHAARRCTTGHGRSP